MSLNVVDPSQALSLVKTSIVDLVGQRVQLFIEKGELNLPPGYSAPNALKAAWLILQETQTREKKPVLSACTKDSIANALLDMIVQGLNPAKKQCYFIAYGAQLTCQRSYFGTMALARMVDPLIEEIVAEVIYEGDVCTYRIIKGKKVITEHEQALENVERGIIKGAYCTIYYRGDRLTTEIMSISQIHQAWKQSQMNPFDDKGVLKAGSTHGKFTAEMAKKTVINRACKPIINASDDSTLLQESMHRADTISAEYTAQEEIASHANQDLIDVDALPADFEEEAGESVPTPPKKAPQSTLYDDEPGF